MAINFPDSPSNGDTTTLAGKTYTFDSSKSKWSPSGAVTLSALSVGAEGTASGDGGIAYNGAGVFSFTPAVAAGSSVTSYAAPTNFPSSGNSVGDFAFATNAPKALYVWDGAEWDRIYSDSQEGPTFTTSPNSSYELTPNANTDVTISASANDGFPISYSVVTNPTNQAQATITQPTTGTFRFAASNSSSNAGSMTAKFIADDGVIKKTASSTFSLDFFPTSGAVIWDFAQGAYSGSGTTLNDSTNNSNYTLTLSSTGGTYTSNSHYTTAVNQTINWGSRLNPYNAKTVMTVSKYPTGTGTTLRIAQGTGSFIGRTQNQNDIHWESYSGSGTKLETWSGETIVAHVNGTSVTTQVAAWNAQTLGQYQTWFMSGGNFRSDATYGAGYMNPSHELRAIIMWDRILTVAEKETAHATYRSRLGASNMPAWGT